MEKARQGKLESSRGASRLRLRLENVYLQSSLRENNGCCEAIRTGADDASSAYQFSFPLTCQVTEMRITRAAQANSATGQLQSYRLLRAPASARTTPTILAATTSPASAFQTAL